MTATEREDPRVSTAPGLDEQVLVGGTVGGLLAGVLMGLVLQQTSGVMEVIGGLYAMDSLTAGWIFHLIHATLFGAVFAMGLSSRPFAKYEFGPVAVALLGLYWGVALWVLAAGVVMPFWMGTMGLTAPPVPNWQVPSGIGHLVYGATLGTAVAMTRQLSP